jgi:hypothetical protein
MVMVLRSYDMSKATRFVLPLISDKITKDIIKPSTGFVDTYTTDIDRPFLEDCVFLVYKSVNTLDRINVANLLESLDSFYSKKFLTINDEHYTMYAFKNPKKHKDIFNLKNFGFSWSVESKLRVYHFWKEFDNVELNKSLFGDWRIDKIENISPARDYRDIDNQYE